MPWPWELNSNGVSHLQMSLPRHKQPVAATHRDGIAVRIGIIQTLVISPIHLVLPLPAQSPHLQLHLAHHPAVVVAVHRAVVEAVAVAVDGNAPNKWGQIILFLGLRS